MFPINPFFFSVGSAIRADVGPGVGGGANGHGGIPGGEFASGAWKALKGPKFSGSLQSIVPDVTDTYAQAIFTRFDPSKVNSDDGWVDDVIVQYVPSGKIGNMYYAYDYGSFYTSTDLVNWTNIGAPPGFTFQTRYKFINDGTNLSLVYAIAEDGAATYSVMCVRYIGSGWSTPSTIQTHTPRPFFTAYSTGSGKIFVKPSGNDNQCYSSDAGQTWDSRNDGIFPLTNIEMFHEPTQTFFLIDEDNVYTAQAAYHGDGIYADLSSLSLLYESTSFYIEDAAIVNNIPIAFGRSEEGVIRYVVLEEPFTVHQISIPGLEGISLIGSLEVSDTFFFFGGMYYVRTDTPGDMIASTSLTSPDWHVVLNPDRILTLQKFSGIASDGNGTIIALGEEDAVGVSTNFGQTWAMVPTNTESYLTCATYGNDMFVVGGGENVIVTSTDGMNWTLASNLPTSTFELSAIAWGIGTQNFVAVSWYGNILSSSDGTNWTEVFSEELSWYNVRWQKDRFIAVGEDGGSGFPLAYSTDGVNFTQPTGFAVGDTLTDVAYSDTIKRFVAVGYNEGEESTSFKVYFSDNGVIWTEALYTLDGPIIGYCDSVIFANGLFVAVGEDYNGNGIVTTSEDGNVWSAPTIITDFPVRQIEWNGRDYLALAGSTLYSSSDLVTWELVELEISTMSYLSSILAVNGATIAVGENGTIVAQGPI